jgi:hypothetical protein
MPRRRPILSEHQMNMLPTIIVTWFALNALLFAWLAFGRYAKWSDLFHSREVRRL